MDRWLAPFGEISEGSKRATLCVKVVRFEPDPPWDVKSCCLERLARACVLLLANVCLCVRASEVPVLSGNKTVKNSNL